MIEAMKEVGARFEARKIFVPEMMLSARTMKVGLDLIKPLIEKKGGENETGHGGDRHGFRRSSRHRQESGGADDGELGL